MIEEIYLVKFFCLLQALPPGQEGQSHNALTKDYSVDCDSPTKIQFSNFVLEL